MKVIFLKKDLSHIKVLDFFDKKINLDMKNAKIKRDISKGICTIKVKHENRNKQL